MSDRQAFGEWLISILRLTKVAALSIESGDVQVRTHGVMGTFGGDDVDQIKDEMRKAGVASVIAVNGEDGWAISMGVQWDE